MRTAIHKQSQVASDTPKSESNRTSGQNHAAEQPNSLWSHLALTTYPSIQRKCDACHSQQAQQDETNQQGTLANIQPKLAIGAPDDPYEIEADALADKVMRTPANIDEEQETIQTKKINTSPVQRLCAVCNDEQENNTVQTKSKSSTSQSASTSNVQNIISSPSKGSPIPENVRNRVEPVLGADLSSVQVHNNSSSHKAAKEISAKAFTHKNHIYLGAGQSSGDVHLMAHELTHTVQQSPNNVVQRKPDNTCGKSRVKFNTEMVVNDKKQIDTKMHIPKKYYKRPTGNDSDIRKNGKVALVPQFGTHLQVGMSHGVWKYVCFRKGNKPEGLWVHEEYLYTPGPTKEEPIPKDAYDKDLGICEPGAIKCEEPISSSLPSTSITGGLTLTGPDWITVQQSGIVIPNTSGTAKLYDALEANGKSSVISGNTLVYILKKHKTKDMYAVAILGGSSGSFGYVESKYIAKNLPDPDAKLHKVKSGETALGIALTHYPGPPFNVSGKDKRYIVNALSWVNRNFKHGIIGGPGIIKKDPKATFSDADAYAYADAYTWLPGADYLGVIYDKVVAVEGGTGSKTADLWQGVKDLWQGVKKVGEYAAYGAAFVGGLVHGFLKSLYDAIADTLGMVWDIVVSIFKGEIIQDAKNLLATIDKLSWDGVKEALGNAVDSWFFKLNDQDPWVSGHAHGFLTGYIMAEAAQLLFTAGAAAAAKSAIWATKIGAAIKKSATFTKFMSGLQKASTATNKVKTLFVTAGRAIRKTKPFRAIGVARQWLIDAIGVSLKTAEQISLYGANRLRSLSDETLAKLKQTSEAVRRKFLGCNSPCICDPEFISGNIKHINNPEAIKHLPTPSARPPSGYKTADKIKKIDDLPRDAGKNIETLPSGVVYELDGGHKIWKDADGSYRHDSTIGDPLGRAHMEKEYFSAGPHGNPNMKGMERAHTLGQGTGFESPFGMFYAPRSVNQILQNNGIEMFLRQLHKKMSAGKDTLHVLTRTTPHKGSLRLKDIVYKVEVKVSGGERKTLFEYAISVGNDVPHPTVTHGIKGVADQGLLSGLMNSMSGAENFKNMLSNFMKDI